MEDDLWIVAAKAPRTFLFVAFVTFSVVVMLFVILLTDLQPIEVFTGTCILDLIVMFGLGCSGFVERW